MTDPLERRARRAADAVRAETAQMDHERGLTGVMRRGRRPRAAAVLAGLVAVLALSLPAVAALRDAGPTEVEFAEEAPAPTPGPAEAEEAEETDEAPAPTPATEEEPPSPEEAPAPRPAEGQEPEESAEADEPERTPAPQETAAPQENAAPRETLAPAAGFDTQPVAGGFPPGDTLAFLTDVRVGSHDGFDRVVLEFEDGGTSDYEVRYQQPPIVSAGTGDEVDVDGEAFLDLRLYSAAGVDFERGDPYALTYGGPDRVIGETAVVTEVVKTGDFESTLSWVVGLRGRAPFTVTVLEEPLRLVVDIQAPS